MKDENKTGEQLINELVVLRQRITELEAEHKRVQETLRESEERLHLMFESVTDGVTVTDLNGVIIKANERVVRMHGFGREDELLGKSAFELIAPHDHERAMVNMQKTLEQGSVRDIEYSLLKAGRSDFPGELSSSVLKDASGNPIGFIAITRDITERKRAEEALQESMLKYKELAASIGDVFFAFDRELRYIYWNRASEELTGISAKDALGKHIYDIFPKDEQTKKAEEVYLKVLKGKQPQHFVNEYQLGDKHFFFEISAYPTNDGLSVFVKDATNRRLTEEELRKSEAKYRTLIGRLREGVYQTDLNGTYITLNDAGARILGFDSPDQVIGKYKTIDLHYDLSDRAKIIEEIGRAGFFVGEVRAKRRGL